MEHFNLNTNSNNYFSENSNSEHIWYQLKDSIHIDQELDLKPGCELLIIPLGTEKLFPGIHLCEFGDDDEIGFIKVEYTSENMCLELISNFSAKVKNSSFKVLGRVEHYGYPV